MAGPPAREEIYSIVYLDALVVKVRDGHQVRNRSAYIAYGVGLDGAKQRARDRSGSSPARARSSVQASAPACAAARGPHHELDRVPTGDHRTAQGLLPVTRSVASAGYYAVATTTTRSTRETGCRLGLDAVPGRRGRRGLNRCSGPAAALPPRRSCSCRRVLAEAVPDSLDLLDRQVYWWIIFCADSNVLEPASSSPRHEASVWASQCVGS